MRSAAFQRSFTAMSYFMGQREPALLLALPEAHPEALALVERLGHPERPSRAEALAAELTRISAELEHRSFR
jgi:hypothetical protein